MRRTKEQAAETKQQILTAAETLFLDQGYDNVTLEEIALAAGITRGAIHWHFENKRGLLLAIRDEAQVPFQELAERLGGESSADPLVMLGEVIANVFAGLHQDPRRRGLIRVMLHLDIAFTGGEKGGWEELYEAMVKIFVAAQKSKPISPPWSPATAASALNAVMTGLISDWALERSGFELVPYGQELVKMILQRWSSDEAYKAT